MSIPFYVYVLKRDFPNLSAVYTSNFYSTNSFILVGAANRLNIKTFSVQHGVQTQLHPAFTSPVRLPKSVERSVVPAIFICWDSGSCATIRRWQTRWMEVRLEPPFLMREYGARPVSLMVDSRINCLVVLQPSLGELPSFLRKLMGDSRMSDVNFLVRPHPRQNIKDVEKSFESFGLTDRDNVEIADPRESNIFEALSECSYCITGFSTVALEASSLGIVTLFYHEKSLGYYEDLLVSGSGFYFENFSAMIDFVTSS